MQDVAIVGLPGSGKSTVFSAVTGQKVAGPGAQAVVDVPDERLDRVAEIYASERRVCAQMRVVDVGGMDPHSLGAARAADALAVVLRAFGPHADVARDLSSFRAELAVADLRTVENVVERVERKARSGDAAAARELEACRRAEEVLSDDRWLSEESWDDEIRQVVSMWTPLTMKPALVIVNAEEIESAGALDGALVVLGALEAEAAELSAEEAAEVLSAYGVSEPATRRFARAAYRTIDLLTFYTASEDEARAWEAPVGSTAPQAAGVIHSDFERAFIRAERVAYSDLIASGSPQAAKESGLVRLEGKDYVVRDGDVLLIRHSA